MSLDEFWQSTPAELELISAARVKRLVQRAVIIGWYTAALTRAERLPSLASLLQESKNEEELTAERAEHAREFEVLTATRSNLRNGGQK